MWVGGLRKATREENTSFHIRSDGSLAEGESGPWYGVAPHECVRLLTALLRGAGNDTELVRAVEQRRFNGGIGAATNMQDARLLRRADAALQGRGFLSGLPSKHRVDNDTRIRTTARSSEWRTSPRSMSSAYPAT